MSTKSIKDFILAYPARAPNEGAKHFGIDISEYQKLYREVIKKSYKQFMAQLPKTSVVLVTGAVKNGVESFEKYVINWKTKTIVTFVLADTFTMSFDMHNAIQRAYVHQGEGMTAAEVAMHFDFPSDKYIHAYARIHGFTKASPVTTDLQILMGASVEEESNKSLQAFKRKVWQQSEKKKWQEIEKGYRKWADFKSGVLKPFENYVADKLPYYKPPILGKIKLPNYKYKFGWVFGMCDTHYMRLCFSHTGAVVYNRKIAKDRIRRHVVQSIKEGTRFANFDKIMICVGNDNIHVDNSAHTTTAGTTQVGQTEGNYALDVDTYVDITLDYIESFAQLGVPVEVINVWGNHDEQTSKLLGVFLSKFYAKRKNVTVRNEFHSRIYTSYGNTGMMFSHSTGWSQAKLRNNLHKMVMSEAKGRGLSLDKLHRWAAFTFHLHAENFADLNGFMKHYTAPSLSANEWFDDSWHTDKGFIGREPETANYLFHKTEGRKYIFYVK
jgi:hypothetical protein